MDKQRIFEEGDFKTVTDEEYNILRDKVGKFIFDNYSLDKELTAWGNYQYKHGRLQEADNLLLDVLGIKIKEK
jgi:ABC-type lipoprotein export system ATPase subunit